MIHHPLKFSFIESSKTNDWKKLECEKMHCLGRDHEADFNPDVDIGIQMCRFLIKISMEDQLLLLLISGHSNKQTTYLQYVELKHKKTISIG